MEREFNIKEGSSFQAENLTGRIVIQAGEPGIAKVEITGEAEMVDSVEVALDSQGNLRLDGSKMKTPESGEKGGFISRVKRSFGSSQVVQISRSGHGSTVIQSGGNVQIASGIRGKRISIGGINVSVDGNNIQIGGVDTDGDIVVNGVDLKDLGDSQSFELDIQGEKLTINGKEAPTVHVVLPKGMAISVRNVLRLMSDGVGGSVCIESDGFENSEIKGANGLDIKCSGQSRCEVTDASGRFDFSTDDQANVKVVGKFAETVKGKVSDQSRLEIAGEFVTCDVKAEDQATIGLDGGCNVLHVTTDDQARVELKGDVVDLDADADDMSTIRIKGKVHGRERQRARDMATIDIRD